MKKAISIALAWALTLMLVACGGQAQQPASDQGQDAASGANSLAADDEGSGEFELPAIPDDLTGGRPWIDSGVVGNVTASTEASPVDDLYLSVNKDWIVSAQIPEGSQALDRDVFSEARGHVLAALAGDELEHHDARQAQLLFKAFTDTESRDKAECEPAKKVIDDIRALTSVDELSAFLLDVQRSAGVPTFIEVVNRRDYDEHRWVTRVRLSDATFGSTMGTMGESALTVGPEDPIYQARLALVCDVLTRVGYTEAEAKAAFENRLGLEKEIALAERDPADEQEGPRSVAIDELDGLCGAFPLRALAESRGYAQAAEFEVDNAAALHAAGDLFTDEHLDALRDYFICGYALEAGSWLDTQAFEAWRADYLANGYLVSLTMPERNQTVEDTAVNLAAEVLPTPVGRAYVEARDLAHVKEFVEELCAEAIDAHKQIVTQSEWLSDASKQRLTSKLDAITVKAVYPDAWEDYSSLDLDGLSYFEARRAIWLNDRARNAALTGAQIDDRLWDDPSLIEGGGAYDAYTNSFKVDASVCEGDVARYEAGEYSLAELLGGRVGYIVFHEVGHALDTGNIYLDADGADAEESLLDPDDLAEFERRVSKIEQYFDSITIWEGQNVVGEVCDNEALAEICGMQARLAWAEGQDGFDYRVFFEKRAELAPSLHTPEYELAWIMGADLHPCVHLDTNVTVQQFDEFYEAFGVKEGDGMYLSPDERLVVW